MKTFLLLLLLPCFAHSQLCEVLDIPSHARRSLALSTPAPAGYSKTISIYIETDHDMYVYCNKDTNQVRVFVNGWFEQWRLLYLKDSILIRIDSIGYWKTVEPYNWTSSSAVLVDFGTRIASSKPTADACHFVSIKNNGFGGVSYVGGIGSLGYNVSFSHIYTAYYSIPSYSWTVEVLAHESGHMLGSQHTHNCYWGFPDGHTGPIDSCYNCEGGCCVQTVTQPGTIMSYCHLTSFGIDFNKGFGPLPLAAIKQFIWDCYNNGLLKNPDAGLCFAPYITSISTTTNTANVIWSTIGTKYRYHFKPAGQPAYNAYVQTNGNNGSLTGLISATAYYIQVRALCSGIWTSWGNTYKFKTK